MTDRACISYRSDPLRRISNLESRSELMRSCGEVHVRVGPGPGPGPEVLYIEIEHPSEWRICIPLKRYINACIRAPFSVGPELEGRRRACDWVLLRYTTCIFGDVSLFSSSFLSFISLRKKLAEVEDREGEPEYPNSKQYPEVAFNGHDINIVKYNRKKVYPTFFRIRGIEPRAIARLIMRGDNVSRYTISDDFTCGFIELCCRCYCSFWWMNDVHRTIGVVSM